jgi:hypothetical protein
VVCKGVRFVEVWPHQPRRLTMTQHIDPVRGKPCRSGQGQERGRQSRPGGLDWF